jgi:cyclopropane fatty-acyl-phospholipid synthase-like methyltransferase
MTEEPEDVPIPIDFRAPADARDWAASAMTRRPYRVEIFQAIAAELAGRQQVLELGSGPGFLAEAILKSGWTGSYTALDFSDAMHSLARERLGHLAAGMEFVTRDFKEPGWAAGLGPYDAVITMQAVHEVRHKRHVPTLYEAVRELLSPGGGFIMCDIFAGEGGKDDTDLFMTPEEHESALQRAFTGVRLLLRTGGLVLFRATR